MERVVTFFHNIISQREILNTLLMLKTKYLERGQMRMTQLNSNTMYTPKNIHLEREQIWKVQL